MTSNLKSTDTLFARIRESLSSYSAVGQLDTASFFFEVKLFISRLGISMYEIDDDVLHLSNYSHELPCNFYQLESAWLCDKHNSSTKTVDNFQGKIVTYTEKTCEKVILPSCESSCDEKVLDKVTIKEYVRSGKPSETTFRQPRLLSLGSKLTSQYCSKDCQNLFITSQDDISILRRGKSLHLFSSLSEPTIYIRYYAYPIDEDSGLPLIPDEPILERALEDHIKFIFFENLWLNGDDPNVQQKIGYLREKANQSMGDAESFVKLPTFNKMIQLIRRTRRSKFVYQQIDKRHA